MLVKTNRKTESGKDIYLSGKTEVTLKRVRHKSSKGKMPAGIIGRFLTPGMTPY